MRVGVGVVPNILMVEVPIQKEGALVGKADVFQQMRVTVDKIHEVLTKDHPVQEIIIAKLVVVLDSIWMIILSL
jgi:hypothetical protein